MAYEKDALEQKLLDVAEAQLFRHGYKALNLNDVAREAGISKVTLYRLWRISMRSQKRWCADF